MKLQVAWNKIYQKWHTWEKRQYKLVDSLLFSILLLYSQSQNLAV